MFKKGTTPWNKGKVGLQMGWNKGGTISEETKVKISKSNKGKLVGDKNPAKRPEVRVKISEAKLGFHHTEFTKIKMSAIRKGRPAHNKGKSPSIETCRKMSKTHLGKLHSLESRLKQSKSVSGSNNHFYGKKHSDILKQRWLKIRRGTQIGEDNPMYGKPSPKGSGWGKGAYYESPLQGTVWLRSSYELAYAKYLDRNNILWLWELEVLNKDRLIGLGIFV